MAAKSTRRGTNTKENGFRVPDLGETGRTNGKAPVEASRQAENFSIALSEDFWFSLRESKSIPCIFRSITQFFLYEPADSRIRY